MKETKKPITIKEGVVFVGVKARGLAGVDTWFSDSYDGDDTPRICIRISGKAIDVYPDSTDDGIQARIAAMKGVSRSAVPFAPASRKDAPRQTADGSPWLSGQESDDLLAKLKAKDVPTKGLKFYSLAPLYQKMYTINNGNSRFRDPTSIFDEEHDPFLVSGGMASLDRSTWRSVKGLAVPDGALIDVWLEEADVRAFSLTPRWRWKFPEGLVAYDVLLNADGDVFEVRTQTKAGEDWETKVYAKDASVAPPNYHGAGQSCASCHSHTGEVVNVPGRIYMRERWGSDGRFSWRPYKDDGTLDARWPINVLSGIRPQARSQQTVVNEFQGDNGGIMQSGTTQPDIRGRRR